GSSWEDIPAVSDTSAFLLNESDRVRFVPNQHIGGDLSISLTFLTWDQTDGTVHTNVDPTDNNAFSDSGASLSQPVIAVADAPNLNVNPATGDEDTAIPLDITSSLV